MSSLNEAQHNLRDHLAARVEVDPLAAIVPAYPAQFAGYVWPASDWIEPDDEGTFCVTRSVGLVVDLVAGVTDLEHSQEWLNDRVDEVWSAASSGVEVVEGETITPLRAGRPIIVRTEQGAELLVVRIEFTRFTLED